MRASDVMTLGVRTVSATAAAEDAWEFMRRERIHHLVVMQGSRLAGILSDRDAGGPRGRRARADRTVADLMTRDVVTVEPETPVRKVANLMRGRSIGCVVVTDKRRVTGIITVTDLLDMLGKGVDRPTVTGKARPSLHHRVPHRKRQIPNGVW